MSDDIHILPMSDHVYAVDLHASEATTNHRVTVDDRFRDDLGVIDLDEQLVVRESFHFLLDHEPATSIAPEFTLSELADSHPDYVPELRARITA